MTEGTAKAREAAPAVKEERRAARRLKISRAILIRPSDPQFPEEVQATLNASKNDLYFRTSKPHYYVGMRVGVIVGYVPNDPFNSVSFGKIVRIDRIEGGNCGIAIRLFMR